MAVFWGRVFRANPVLCLYCRILGCELSVLWGACLRGRGSQGNEGAGQSSQTQVKQPKNENETVFSGYLWFSSVFRIRFILMRLRILIRPKIENIATFFLLITQKINCYGI